LIRKNINLANENYENKAIMNIDKCDEFANDEEELEEKKASLAENERKLKELYSMQERLSQLKEIINHFNGLKKTQNELSHLRDESEPAASIVSTNEKYEKYLSEQTNSIAEKINTKLN
jgi:predicted mannosyl-3-phosphoglycerate phosphatase (HAD superfamily)